MRGCPRVFSKAEITDLLGKQESPGRHLHFTAAEIGLGRKERARPMAKE